MKKVIALTMVLALLVIALPTGAAPLNAPPQPGTEKTNIYVQNIGTTNANFQIEFTKQDGSPTTPPTKDFTNVPPISAKNFIIKNETMIPDGWAGSAVVSSDQPVASIVNRFWEAGTSTPQLAATYSGVGAPDNGVYCPNLLKNDTTWRTRVTVQNTESGSAAVSLKYYNRAGTLVHTVNDTIAGMTQKTYDLQDNASIDFSATSNTGSVYIESTTNKLAATVALFQTNVANAMGYTCMSEGDTTIWIPSVFRRGFNIDDSDTSNDTWELYNANIIQNLSDTTAASITVDFLGKAGYPSCQLTDSIPPLSAVAYNTRYQGTTDPTKYAALMACIKGGVANDWVGTVRVTSSGPNIVGIGLYNPLKLTKDSGAFEAILDKNKANTWYCSSVFRKLPGTTADQWSTSLVQNTSDSATAQLTAEYYDTSGTLVQAYNNFTTVGTLASAGLHLKSGVDLPSTVATDLGTTYVGAVKITSTGAPIVVMNNIFFTGTNRGSAYTCSPAP